MGHRAGAASHPRAATGAALVFLAAVLLGRPAVSTWPEQARLFVSYMRATGSGEEPMGLMERITVSYLMAGQKAEKAKEAGARPASPDTRI
jgi:hypothetical protein